MPTTYRDPDYRAANRRIVSVDGEGNDVAGRHAYTLLAAADDRGYRRHLAHDGTTRQGTAEDRQHCPWRPPVIGQPPHNCEKCYRSEDTGPNHGLPTKVCLEFLLSLPRNRSDLIIAFSFTYDTTKILQDIPWGNLVELRMTGQTQWRGYTIREMPRKYFEVSHGDRRVKVWDTFSYWQMAFAKALSTSLGLFDEQQRGIIDFITDMKAQRDHLETLPFEQVLEYCYSECEFLSILYRDFLRQCETEAVDLTLSRHSGPGGLAESFFEREGIRAYMPTPGSAPAGIPENVPQMAYYGGRFETARLGVVGDVWEYDIHSAYPAVAVTLPCLECGWFREVDEYDPSTPFGFYYVGSETHGSPWAPFPFRSDGSPEHRQYLNGATKGSIAFVHGGRRWVTGHELAVARKYFTAEQTPVYRGYVFVPDCNHRPFAEVAKLYAERMRLKETDKHRYAGLIKVLKLIINSIYGKTAQSTGLRLDPRSEYHPSQPEAYSHPKFQCYAWAAWMTGGTRAKVLDAALLGGDDVVSVATDGILTTRRLDSEAINGGLVVTDYTLGTWEREDKHDCWLGMPGIYAFGRGDDAQFKRRGLDGRYFPARHLRREWERGEWIVPPLCVPCDGKGCDECGHTGEGQVRAYMPMRLALMRTNGLNTMGEWVSMPKRVQFGSIQHKRNLPDDIIVGLPHDGATLTLEPIEVPSDFRSKPYEPKVTWEKLYAMSLQEEGITEELLASLIGDMDMPMWDETDSMEW